MKMVKLLKITTIGIALVTLAGCVDGYIVEDHHRSHRHVVFIDEPSSVVVTKRHYQSPRRVVATKRYIRPSKTLVIDKRTPPCHREGAIVVVPRHQHKRPVVIRSNNSFAPPHQAPIVSKRVQPNQHAKVVVVKKRQPQKPTFKQALNETLESGRS